MNLNDIRDSAEYKITNDKQREIMSNIYIGDCIRELNIIFEQINKNLEKIANKDIIRIGDLKTTVNNVGNYLKKEDLKKQLDTIICNQNKDSYVDKNIILD